MRHRDTVHPRMLGFHIMSLESGDSQPTVIDSFETYAEGWARADLYQLRYKPPAVGFWDCFLPTCIDRQGLKALRLMDPRTFRLITSTALYWLECKCRNCLGPVSPPMFLSNAYAHATDRL